MVNVSQLAILLWIVIFFPFFFAIANDVPWTLLYLLLSAHEQDSRQIFACRSVTERLLGLCIFSFTRYCGIALQTHGAYLHSPSSVSPCSSTALSTLVSSDVNCCQSDGCEMNLIVVLICSSLFASEFLHTLIGHSDGLFCGLPDDVLPTFYWVLNFILFIYRCSLSSWYWSFVDYILQKSSHLWFAFAFSLFNGVFGLTEDLKFDFPLFSFTVWLV